MMTRRSVLSAAAATLLYSSRSTAHASPGDSKLGIATTSYLTVLRPKDTYQFLEHSHSLGAAGIQASINGDLPKLRKRADELGMYIEAMVVLPKNPTGLEPFEKSLQDAKAVGALCARTASLSSRRYETFTTWNDYQAWEKNSNAILSAVVPLLEKYKIPLGVENHKDRTVDQLVGVLKRYSSEYLGCCLDLGNNISLLDDPMDVIEKLAPYAVTMHFKDMAVAPYDDGFLLSEVILGDGFLDLPRMLSTIRAAKPKINILLEMITRDPLKVPCLTDNYWVTFPDRNGRYLANTLKLVRAKTNPSKPLPRISQLSHEQQLQQEEENVKRCMSYAKTTLNL